MEFYYGDHLYAIVWGAITAYDSMCIDRESLEVNGSSWKDWDPIIGIAEPLVLPRLFTTADEFAAGLKQEGNWTDDDIQHWLDWRLDLPIMDVEATIIRKRIQSGEPIDDLLPDPVQNYIRSNSLYCNVM